jgi:NAD(P)-dependent dehydrogenase (short-subunit alcohol dehydrogenase family)
MNQLHQKHVLVLGGASGIGLATAKLAATRGAHVIVSSRSSERGAQAAREVGHGARSEVVNLANEDEISALFQRLPKLDHLVYTAGDELLLTPLSALELATARRFFELRLFSALATVKHAAPQLNPGGSIVLTHGIAGARPQAGWSVASALCGAMDALTRALAVELAPLRVNAVSPGLVRTSLWNTIPEAERGALFDAVGGKLLTKRIGEAPEIAEAYCHFMQNTFATGQTLIVDGGAMLV